MRSGEADDQEGRRIPAGREPRGVTERRGEAAPRRPDRRRGPAPRPDDGTDTSVTGRMAGGRAPREPERPDRAARAARRHLTAAKAARLAAACVAEMTGKQPEEITAVEVTDDGRWQVDVEVVETRRIPDSTDILAIYRAELDTDGELLAYRRVKRYTRCQVGER